jgi:hypothetical protein
MVSKTFLDEGDKRIAFDALSKRQALYINLPISLEFDGGFTVA